MGTIEYCFENLDTHCISVRWDSVSRLSLIEEVDQYEILNEERELEEEDTLKHLRNTWHVTFNLEIILTVLFLIHL
jgi:hypothetical protein